MKAIAYNLIAAQNIEIGEDPGYIKNIASC